jgi:hypothetical protein
VLYHRWRFEAEPELVLQLRTVSERDARVLMEAMDERARTPA